ncbi:MAG: ribonuclease III [Candidatus Nomurabacteria bacterium]|jgi:ribonuclease-3|nr:ribonuclease III [Candidatus Nomurabacteria bacterium]
MSGMDLTPYHEWAKEALGFDFDNIDLLATALTHRSYVNEHKKSTKHHNERLEFLGDAVLELAVTRFLYENYSEPEGTLTAWRSALVRTESIRDAGVALGYEHLIRTSRGEKKASESAKKHIVANAFEALIGAIYLEKGYDVAEKFIAKNILSKMGEIIESGSWRDPKSHLQELSQRYDLSVPLYKVLAEDGPDHDKNYTVGAFVGSRKIGVGTGTSKQAAEQTAAREGIKAYADRRKTKAKKPAK